MLLIVNFFMSYLIIEMFHFLNFKNFSLTTKKRPKKPFEPFKYLLHNGIYSGHIEKKITSADRKIQSV